MNDEVTVAGVGANTVLALFGVLTFNQWMTLVSVLCGVGTMLISWYYKRKEDKRRERRERGE